MATRRPDTFRQTALRRRAMQRKKPRRRRLGVFVFLGLLGGAACGGWLLLTPEESPPPPRTFAAPPRGVYWFQDDHFGIMLTWGPVSLTGKEISWSRGSTRPCDETRERRDLLPREVYDSLYYRFNPQAFDAAAWVELFKEAGARYVVLVTKHHDGFCLFDTKLSEYKITRSPIGRDLTAELADACHAAGLRLGFYYSAPDWKQPDYCTNEHAAYLKYMHAQILELCSDYGRVDLFWFDSLGMRAADWEADALVSMIETYQPAALINDRLGLPGDFTSRDELPDQPELMRPWERVLNLGTQRSFKPDDKLKTASEVLCELLRAAGRGGNLLLNIGPQPDGLIEQRQADILHEIGAWLSRCGEAVYRTRAGPYWPTQTYVSTRRDRMVYLHLLEWPDEPIELPDLGRRLLAATMLTGGSVSFEQNDGRIRLSLAIDRGERPPWTIRLELDAAPPPMQRQ